MLKKKKYRRMALFLLVFALLAAGVRISGRIGRSDSIKKSMVYMENNGAGGNGSVYQITEDKIVIVTTYHLLQNGELLSVRFWDNFYAEGSVLGFNKEHDVGFVTVPLEEVSEETLQRIECIWRNDSLYDSLKQGDYMAYHFLSYDNAFVCSEVHEGSIGDMDFYIEEFADTFIYNYCEIKPGMSGCAAVAWDGSYLGMAVGGYDNESAALSIRVIDRVYQELMDFTKS